MALKKSSISKKRLISDIKSSVDSSEAPVVDESVHENLSNLPESALFQPFKMLGAVCSGSVAPSVTVLGTCTFISASVGSQFLVYDENLRVSFMSVIFESKITALATLNETTFVAIKNKVYVYQKKIRTAELSLKDSSVSLIKLEVFGDFLLGLTDCGKMAVFELPQSLQKRAKVDFEIAKITGNFLSEIKFPVTGILLLPTYVNKVLVYGSEHMILLNVASQTVIFDFQETFDFIKNDKISTISATTVLDVVAIATKSSNIHLVNIKTGEHLMTVSHSGPHVNKMIYTDLKLKGIRDDEVTGILMCVGVSGEESVISMYDMNKQGELITKLSVDFEISYSCILPGDILLLQGLQRMQMRILEDFTRENLFSQILRERQGFLGTPRFLLPSNTENDIILGTSKGEIGIINVLLNQQTTVFSSKGKKLSPVISMSLSPVRHYDWPALVTIHENDLTVHVWSANNKVLSDTKLLRPKGTRTVSFPIASSVSPCGNFAVIGYQDGAVFKFNLQSGTCKGKVYETTGSGMKLEYVSSSVFACLTSNKLVLVDGKKSVTEISSCLDGAGMTCMALYGCYALIGKSDGTVIVVDIVNDVLVRVHEYSETVPVISVSWKSQGKQMAVCRGDGTLSIYDLSGSFLRDQLIFLAPISACIFTETLGIFASVTNQGALTSFRDLAELEGEQSRPLCPKEPVCLEEFFYSSEVRRQDSNNVADESLLKETDGHFLDAAKLMEFSTVPLTTQKSILVLDMVKQRNILQKTKADKIPFFLAAGDNATKAKKSTSNEPENLFDFEKVSKLFDSKNFSELRNELKKASPSGVHLFFASIPNVNDGLDFFTWAVKEGKDADLVQVWLRVFLDNSMFDFDDIDETGLKKKEDLVKVLKTRESLIWEATNRLLCMTSMLATSDLLV
jgi:U3 small nucleolar RNA-associated protein 21